MVVRPCTTHDGAVMTIHRRVGSRAPLSGLIAAVLALLLLPTLVLGAEWTALERVTAVGGSRLDSLHQAGLGQERAAPGASRASGPRRPTTASSTSARPTTAAAWSKERTHLQGQRQHRKVVPNLAIEATRRHRGRGLPRQRPLRPHPLRARQPRRRRDLRQAHGPLLDHEARRHRRPGGGRRQRRHRRGLDQPRQWRDQGPHQPRRRSHASSARARWAQRGCRSTAGTR